MTENIKLINELIDKGGNCVNLSRSIKAKYPELFQYILDNTKFLDDKPNLKINERIYCIANNITSRVRNNFGEYAIFTDIFHGYSIREHTHSKYLSGVKTKQEKENKRIAKESIPKLSERDQKIQKAIIRQKQRRPQLYEDDAVEIQDYVECPISGIRFSMLNEKHITGTLGMSVDEFDSLYPKLIKVSNNHKQKVKEVLQTIDENTGKTIHQTAIEKAQKTLHSVDEHGISGYKKLGQKTRATHMTNIDEHGRNGYQRQAYYRVTTIQENGLTVEQNAHIKLYKNLAKNYSRKAGASMVSKKVLSPIVQLLKLNNVKFYFDEGEYGIKDPSSSKYFFYDLTIPSFDMTIEYQSNAYHANPAWDSSRWDSWKTVRGPLITAPEKLEYDYMKAKAIFEERGIRTYYVWEDSAESDVEGILCLLKTHYMKY